MCIVRPKEDVKIAAFRHPVTWFPFVDARSESFDNTLIAQRQQRLITAIHQFGELGVKNVWLQ